MKPIYVDSSAMCTDGCLNVSRWTAPTLSILHGHQLQFHIIVSWQQKPTWERQRRFPFPFPFPRQFGRLNTTVVATDSNPWYWNSGLHCLCNSIDRSKCDWKPGWTIGRSNEGIANCWNNHCLILSSRILVKQRLQIILHWNITSLKNLKPFIPEKYEKSRKIPLNLFF